MPSNLSRCLLAATLMSPPAARAMHAPQPPVTEQVDAAPDLAHLSAQVTEMVETQTLGTFWGGIIVARDGLPIATYTNGLADKRRRPIDADSLFDIASVSKHYTAVAILRLQQDGELQVADPVSKYFDVGGKSANITIQHLLNHTSGLDDRLSLQRLDFPDRDEAVRIAMNSKLQSFPGDEFHYSNAGYVVLAAIVEKVTGGTYEDYMRTAIFPLANLQSTGFLDGVGLARRRRHRHNAERHGAVEPCARWRQITG
jgi:CubicO group peptidase (beta-lactamase class C family)